MSHHTFVLKNKIQMENIQFIMLLVWSVLFLDGVKALRMTQQTYLFFAEPGDRVELSCASNSMADVCRFTRPDGVRICSPDEGDDFYWGELLLSDATKSENCVTDSGLLVQPYFGNKCSLVIHSVVKSENEFLDDSGGKHYGDWICEIEDKMMEETVKATISLMQKSDFEEALSTWKKELRVEFTDLWGDVTFNVGKLKTREIRCGVMAVTNEGANLRRRTMTKVPGQMIWFLGDQEISRSGFFKKDDYDEYWYQEYRYTPKILDNGKKLTCALEITGIIQDQAKDSITIHTVFFDSNDVGKYYVIKPNERNDVQVSFEASPEPKENQLFWEIDDGSGTITRQKLGVTSKDKNFVTSNLQYHGKKKYTAGLAFMETLSAETINSLEITLVVNLGSQGMDQGYKIPLRLEIFQKIPSVFSTESTITTLGGTSSSTSLPTVALSSSGTSLYIVVSIIALVFLMCTLFYFTQCWKGKNTTDLGQNGKNENKPLKRIPSVATDIRTEHNHINTVNLKQKSANGINAFHGAASVQDKEDELLDKLELIDEVKYTDEQSSQGAQSVCVIGHETTGSLNWIDTEKGNESVFTEVEHYRGTPELVNKKNDISVHDQLLEGLQEEHYRIERLVKALSDAQASLNTDQENNDPSSVHGRTNMT